MGGRYFNTPARIDGASSLIIADDNNLVAGGFSSSSFLRSDGLMAKFNQGNLDLMWARITDNIITPTNFLQTYIFDIDKIPISSSSEQYYIATGYTYLSNFGSADIMATMFHKDNFNCYSVYSPEVLSMSGRIRNYCDLEPCLLSPYHVTVTPAEIHGKVICPR